MKVMSFVVTVIYPFIAVWLRNMSCRSIGLGVAPLWDLLFKSLRVTVAAFLAARCLCTRALWLSQCRWTLFFYLRVSDIFRLVGCWLICYPKNSFPGALLTLIIRGEVECFFFLKSLFRGFARGSELMNLIVNRLDCDYCTPLQSSHKPQTSFGLYLRWGFSLHCLPFIRSLSLRRAVFHPCQVIRLSWCPSRAIDRHCLGCRPKRCHLLHLHVCLRR